MAIKFGRNFVLSVQDIDSNSETFKDVLTIGPPFTCKFSINRSLFGSPNSATIQILNLNQDSRSFLRKDQNDFPYQKGILFMAGYGEDLFIALKGNVNVGQSVRNGVDYVTTLQCFDGGSAFLNSNFSGQFYKNTTDRAVLRNMAKSLTEYGVSVGAISDSYTRKSTRGNAYSGNAIDLMNEISGGGVFIDNGIVHCLRDNEYIIGDTLLINAESGIIGTPTREFNNVTFNMLFEPRLSIAGKIRIEIGSEDWDGDYVVRAISHNGTISESVGETCTSSVTCSPAKYMKGVLPNAR